MIEVSAIKSKQKLEAMKSYLRESSMRDWLLFVLGINVGLRVSDLLSLTASDVKGQSSLALTESKTGKKRSITLNKAAKEAIAEYLVTVRPTGYLFASRQGNSHITRVQAWRILNDAARKVGIKGEIGTHTLRKTFGYWAYKQGIDISLLQKIFNHSSPSVTIAYIGITKEDIADVYNGLNL